MMRRALLPLLVLLLGADGLLAQERVLVRRLSDVVGIREGSPPTERVLYYFEPTAQLVQGDQVEQGSGGQSEIILSAGGLVSMHASAHVILRRISEYGDILDFPLLTTLEARAVDRPLSISLPGGTRCNLLNTEVYVSVQPGRMQIRNQGGMPITVTGDLLLRRGAPPDGGRGELRLQRGEEVHIPLFDVSGATGEGVQTERWGVLPVRHLGEARLERDGERLTVSLPEGAEAGPGGTVTIGGVATRPGKAHLVIRNPGFVEPPPVPEDPPEAPSQAGAEPGGTPEEGAAVTSDEATAVSGDESGDPGAQGGDDDGGGDDEGGDDEGDEDGDDTEGGG